MLWVLQETFFERQPAREGRTATIFDDSKNLASPSLHLGPDAEGNTKRPEIDTRREPQISSILAPRFQRGAGVYDHTGGTYFSQWCDRLSEISDFGLASGKFPDSMQFLKLESQLQN